MSERNVRARVGGTLQDAQDVQVRHEGQLKSAQSIYARRNGELVQVWPRPSAIPDSVTNQWRMDEGTGSTLADSVGSVSASLTGGTWQSGSSYTGGYRVYFSGNSEYWETDSTFAINGSVFSAMAWVTPDNATDSDYILTTTDGSQGGWAVRFLSGPEFQYGHWDSNGNFNEVGRVSVPSVQTYFVAVAANGNSGTIYVYDSSALVGSTSGSATRSTAPRTLVGMSRLDDPANRSTPGSMDAPAVSTSTEMSQAEIEDYWQATLR